MSNSKARSTRAFFLTFIAAFSWAISIVATKMAMNSGDDPFLFSLWSTIIAFLLWIPLLIKQRKNIKQVRFALLGLLILIAIGKTIISLSENLAIKYSPAINYSFLIRTTVVFTAIFALFFFKEKITLKKSILICMILFGSFLLITKGKQIHLSIGDLFTLLEAATIAMTNNILLKKLIGKLQVDLASIITFLMSAVLLAVTSLSQITFALPKRMDLIIISVVFGTIILSSTRNRAYQYASASFVTMIMSFTPVFVSVMSILFLHETMTAVQITGGILIVISGFLAQLLKI